MYGVLVSRVIDNSYEDYERLSCLSYSNIITFLFKLIIENLYGVLVSRVIGNSYEDYKRLSCLFYSKIFIISICFSIFIIFLYINNFYYLKNDYYIYFALKFIILIIEISLFIFFIFNTMKICMEF